MQNRGGNEFNKPGAFLAVHASELIICKKTNLKYNNQRTLLLKTLQQPNYVDKQHFWRITKTLCTI